MPFTRRFSHSFLMFRWSVVLLAADLPVATSESVGVDSKRLEAVTQRMQEFVDAGELSGVVTLAARHGRRFTRR